MPVVPSSFSPPPLVRNGHLQTVLPVFLRRRFTQKVQTERLELPDGDFLDLAWARVGSERLAILTHGLEGNVQNGCIRGMAQALTARGWDVLSWNLRGCGPEPNRTLRFYHSGETGDLRAVVERAARDHPQLALVGFSLGGNLSLKYLGEAPAHPAVRAAAAVSVPIDLAASARALDGRWDNRVYLWRFLALLNAKARRIAKRHPGRLVVTPAARSFREFDDRYTAPLHGFRDAAHYWAESSARQYLPGIQIPTLLLNARDDPFLTPSCFPDEEAEANPCLFLETPTSGGHVGFIDGAAGWQPWSERRVPEFLARAMTKAK